MGCQVGAMLATFLDEIGTSALNQTSFVFSILDRFWLDPGSILGSFSYKSAQTVGAKRLFSHFHLSCNKVAQETEKRTKMDTEWNQNGALLLQKCTNRRGETLAFTFSPKTQFWLKIDQTITENLPKNDLKSIRRASGPERVRSTEISFWYLGLMKFSKLIKFNLLNLITSF